MKSLVCTLGLFLFFAAGSDESRLPKEEAQRYAKVCVEQADKSGGGPIKTIVDPEQACAVRGEGGGAMAVPDKMLTEQKLLKLQGEIVPVGQLWLRKWTLVVDGTPIAAKQLRIVKVKVDEQVRPMPLLLLGIRKTADKKMELLIYAKKGEPLLIVPLKSIEFVPETPLELEWARGDKQIDPLTLKILGRFQADLFITRAGK